MKKQSVSIAVKSAAAGIGLIAAQASDVQVTGEGSVLAVYAEATESGAPRSVEVEEVESTDNQSVSTESSGVTVFKVLAPLSAEWPASKEKEFEILAMRHINGELSPAEEAAFAQMEQARRFSLQTRTFEQIRADVRLHQVTVAAIQVFAEMIDL
jgi:hypothetical protein